MTDYDFDRQNVATLVGMNLDTLDKSRAHVFHYDGYDVVRFVSETGTFEITVKRVENP